MISHNTPNLGVMITCASTNKGIPVCVAGYPFFELRKLAAAWRKCT